MRKGSVYIGTSGWMYKDWGREFYPAGLKKGHLSFLAAEFPTVEVNSSFYHLPLPSTFDKWRKETPDGFVFAVKISRYLTHHEKLVKVKKSLDTFLARAKRLREKLGPVLVQLPPWLPYDEMVLESFLTDLGSVVKKHRLPGARFALEPRHASWLDNAVSVRRALKSRNVALVFPHSAKIPSFPPDDENVTADFVYVRFHGPGEFAASRYGPRRLRPWIDRIRKWKERGLAVFAYFNNDEHGHAISDARTLVRGTA